MDLSSLSDEELLALHDKLQGSEKPNPDNNLGGTLSFLGKDTGIKIPPGLEAGIIGAGRTGSQWIEGAKGLFYDAFNKDKAQEQKKQQAVDTASFRALEDKYPLQTFAGQVGPYLGVPGGIAGSAVAAGMEYGTPEDRAKNAGLAVAGGTAAKLFARAIGPSSMATKGANQWDIPLTTGQATGSKPAQIMESVLSNLPLGGRVNKARDESYGAFNRALSRQFGEDSSKITPELLGAARAKIGGEIGDIASRNSIAADKDLFLGLQGVASRAQQELTEDEAKIVANQVQQVWRAVDPATGTIPGTLYKALQSKLGELAKNRGGTVANIIGDMRTTMREAMNRSVSPDDAAAWAKANERYFNVKQVADAAKSTPGELSPAQLLMQVNNAQKSSRFGGGNELADLARFGKAHLPDKVPNSGTTQRLFYQKLLTNPVSAAGGLLGADYAANQFGGDISAEQMAATVAVPLAVARVLAGKPVSPSTRRLLESLGGGLLSTQF